MRARVLASWEDLRTSFWFVPALLTGGAIVLAVLMVALDEAVGYAAIEEAGWLYTGGPEGARALLSTVAGSVITVAGVTFSITIAVLTLASSQFGPRLLRTFVRDSGNQVVLGTFIATFMYCLLVLRTVRGTDDLTFVPHIAVTVAVLLAIASLGVLIYFIHHVAVAIQVDHIIAAVSDDLHEAIDRLFPEQLGQPAHDASAQDAPALPPDFDQRVRKLPASEHGYIQLIDGDQLMQLATHHNLLVRLERRAGDFVVPGDALLAVFPCAAVTAELETQLGNVFVLDSQRTLTQDVRFAFNQLVEIAVRALSPGINDPFTAITCIDYLGGALCRMAGRSMPAPYRADDEGRLRVISDSLTDDDLVGIVFDPIREYGRGSSAVVLRLMETIGKIAVRASRERLLAALGRQAQLLIDDSRESLFEDTDRQKVMSCYQDVRAIIAKEA